MDFATYLQAAIDLASRGESAAFRRLAATATKRAAKVEGKKRVRTWRGGGVHS
jgi:hypothetical protein